MKDQFTREWIIEQSIDVLSNYEPGVLTIRGLHYQLVSRGMTNDIQHYKRVVAATGVARWNGSIAFDAFSDRDRSLATETEADPSVLEEKIDQAKEQVGLWMKSYHLHRWENQPYYPEVFIEKKALEGVFYKRCEMHGVALGACKGYPSLTFLHDAMIRFKEAEDRGQQPIIIYFGDYDPSGEDIPRALKENIVNLGCESIEVRRICLVESQVIDWKLPPAPTKVTDSRSVNWDGLGQVELDAVKPEKLIELLDGAIYDIFDQDIYDDLIERESIERETFQSELKRYVREEL
jgi:hypothetical protein